MRDFGSKNGAAGGLHAARVAAGNIPWSVRCWLLQVAADKICAAWAVALIVATVFAGVGLFELRRSCQTALLQSSKFICGRCCWPHHAAVVVTHVWGAHMLL
jgi:hypothetical protein